MSANTTEIDFSAAPYCKLGIGFTQANPMCIKNWPRKNLRNHIRICVATYWWNKYAVMDTVYYVFHWFNMEFPWCCYCCRYLYVCHWRWELFFFVLIKFYYTFYTEGNVKNAQNHFTQSSKIQTKIA